MNPQHDYDATSGHGEWDALAVGWAMSALDPEDEAIFLPHLATCDQCARTVAETTRTVGEIAFAVPVEEPPPALRSRLMSAVYAEPRAGAPYRGDSAPPPRSESPFGPAGRAGPPSSAGRPGSPGEPPAGPFPPLTEPFGSALPGGPEPFGPGSFGPGSFGPAGEPPGPSLARPPVGQPPVGGPPAQRPGPTPPGAAESGPSGPGRHAAPGPDAVVVPFRRRLARRPLAAAAAAVAVIAGLGGWNAKLQSDQSDLQRRVAQRDTVIQKLTEPGSARVVALNDAAGQRVATVVARPTDTEVVTEALPVTTGDAHYWLWGLDSLGEPSAVPLAAFTVNSGEVSVQVVGSTNTGLDKFAAFAVSRERGAGKPTAPTTPLVATGQFR
jgi:hypothetical protein